MERTFLAVAISGSPSATSKSALLGDRALRRLEQEGLRVRRIALANLDADDLLGRTATADLGAALRVVSDADIVVATTPVYRATFSGLLKVFFDLLPQDALGGKVGLGLATGGMPQHAGVVDDVDRLLESVGASIVPGAYGLDSEFQEGRPDAALALRVDRCALAVLQRAEEIREASPRTSVAGRPVGRDDINGETRHVVR